MFFPYRDDNPRRHGPPLATLAIIGISTAVYLLVQLPLGPYEGQAYALSFGFIPAVFFGEAELVSELARVPSTATLFTSMFSHGGLMHLVGNMWFLWLYGDNVEDAMGRFRYLFFYLISGCVGTLAHAGLNPASQVPLVGASGAISGVIAAYILIWPRAKSAYFIGSSSSSVRSVWLPSWCSACGSSNRLLLCRRRCRPRGALQSLPIWAVLPPGLP